MTEQSINDRTCGRPTKSGQPCRARIYGSDVACRTHTTDHEREVSEAYTRGFREGLELARNSAEEYQDDRVKRLEQRIAELELEIDGQQRVFEVAGDQLVEVGKYSYRWSGRPPLKVGDRVLLPENWVSRLKDGAGPQVGIVTKLGSTYRGELARIIGRAPADD